MRTLSAVQSRSRGRNARCKAPGQQPAKSIPQHGTGCVPTVSCPACCRALGTPIFSPCGQPATLSSERLGVGRGSISEPIWHL